MLLSMTSTLRQTLARHRKPLRRTAIALLAAYALYLLAANVFLNTALADKAFNRKPERFQLHYAWAMSLYPGHIHARELRVGGHTRTTRWSARSPRADGRIKLLPLLGRTLRFGTIRSRDVTVAVDRGVRDLPPSAPRAGAARRSPWRVRLDAVRTDSLRELRFGKWVVDGQGEASFALDKVLRGGTTEILPSRLVLPAARLRYDRQLIAEGASLALDLSMAPNTRAQAPGIEKLRYVDAHLTLNGRAPGLAVRERSDGALKFARAQATGKVDADLRVRRGVLQPGGRLRWTAPITLDSATNDAQGYALRLEADVQDDAIRVRAQVPKRGTRPDFVSVDLRLPERRLQPPDAGVLLRTASGNIDLHWQFATLRWINPLLSSGWLRLDGAAEVVASLRVRDGALQPGSRVDMPDATVQADVFDNVLSGRAHARAVVETTRTTLDFVADRFALAPRAAPGQAYVRGRDLRLDVTASPDLSRFRRTMATRLRFDGAEVPDLRAYNRNLPGDGLRFTGGSGTVGADLRIDADGDVRSAQVRLRGKRAAIWFSGSNLIGDLALDTRLARSGAAQRRYRIEAFDLGLDNVRLGGGSDPAWWAKLALDDGSFEWREPFRFRADPRLTMKDASLLLSLFDERSRFPKWIGNIVDAGQIRATAAVSAEGGALVVDRLRASNERIDLQARLRTTGGKPYGDLYARWGVLGLGMALRGEQRKLRLRNAKEWYESQPALLPVARGE